MEQKSHWRSQFMAHLIVPIMLTVAGCTFSPTGSTCGEVLPGNELYVELEQTAREMMAALRVADAEAVRRLYSDHVLQAMGESGVKKALVEFVPLLPEDEHAELLSIHHLKQYGLAPSPTVCGLIPKEDPKHHSVLTTIAKGRAAFVQFTAPAGEKTMRVTFQIEDGGKGWELAHLAITTYAYKGKNGQDYENLYREAMRGGKLVEAALYLAQAKYLYIESVNMRSGHTNRAQRMLKSLLTSQDYVEKARSIDVGESSFTLSWIHLDQSEEGPIVVVPYVTERELGDTKEEAKAIHDAFIQGHTKLRDYFVAILIKAYEENPSDPTRLYPAFGHIFMMGSNTFD